MVLISRLSRFLVRNVRSSLRASVRHYDPETGGEEIRSTTVTMLSKEDDDYLYVEAYSNVGFKLSNGFRIVGPCVLFPRSILHWAIGGTHELNEDSLSLFPLLEPKLDLLVLGVGDHGAKYDKSIVRYLRSNNINVEILPTDQACSTFNFLNAERRIVAAAMIPPTYMNLDRDDEDLHIRARLEAEENLYELKSGFGDQPLIDESDPVLKGVKEKVFPALGLNVKKETETGKAKEEGRKSKDSDRDKNKKGS
ncbi:NADH dehydrogenase [ubiquinone] 1 alpha subcomplex assembly factor 3-like [Littorina saxatilis]|uniref:NADH dehydrogenase [ubiquinone] 1 alpha subcomplex assembly factor 3 n=1 Tax=Littorina saxatilis TaxID=31220 RepID=A0AAN9BAN4_9CAEN